MWSKMTSTEMILIHAGGSKHNTKTETVEKSKTCWAHYTSQAVWKAMHKTISTNLL